MHAGEDGDWLSKGIGGALWRSVEGFLRRRMETVEARREERLEAGDDLDEHGLPVGSIPAAFVETREEAHMVYPGAREMFRTTEGASGSMLVRILSFDDGPAAKLSAGYLAPATAVTILDWYQVRLEARGWESRPRQWPGTSAGPDLWDLLQVFHRRGRESFTVEIPTGRRSRLVAERHGLAWPQVPFQTYFEVRYRISVEHPWESQPSS